MGSSGFLFDRSGRVISTEEFGRLLKSREYRYIGSAVVGPYWVTTVWLGVNYDWRGMGLPLIFETAVYLGREYDDHPRPTDFKARRWCTEREAEDGRANTVGWVRATLQGALTELEASAAAARDVAPVPRRWTTPRPWEVHRRMETTRLLDALDDDEDG